MTSGTIDIARAFGPLASMHVALDRAGIGMPCGIVARFAGASAMEIDAAIARAVRQFPVLRSRLEWEGVRPVLRHDDEGCSARDEGDSPLLAFSPAADGRVWRYRLNQADGDTWLRAIWMHGVADGISMLRFVEAVRAGWRNTEAATIERPLHAPAGRWPMAAWLPGFLIDQQRRYLRSREPAEAVPGVTWTILPPEQRDAILARARHAQTGMAALLASASVTAFADGRERSGRSVSLNLPVARSEPEGFGGFGFGVGSLRFPVRIDERDSVDARAAAIADRWRQQRDRGWDRNLQRLLGGDPSRHRRFAEIEARRSADPNVTVSWKGNHAGLGADGALDSIACFAVAPTLHVSSHADAKGLSLSVTSRQSQAMRHGLLAAIVTHLTGARADFTGIDLETAPAEASTADVFLPI